MFNIRNFLKKLADSITPSSAGDPAIANSMKNYVKNIMLNYIKDRKSKGFDIDYAEASEYVLDMLKMKRIIPENDAEISPSILYAVRDALMEVKNDPSFVKPRMQKVTLVYPKDMWDWLNKNGGSDARIPDDYISNINSSKWNAVYQKWQLKQQMKQWIKDYGHKLNPPIEYTSNAPDAILNQIGIPNGNAGLFEQAKSEISSGNNNENINWDEIPKGISSEQLANTFIDSYPEFINKILEEYGSSVNPFDLIKDYAFKAEIGGKSKVKSGGGRTRTFQDQRLNFFWEYPEFIPSHISENMPSNEGEAFKYMYENADELTETLLDLMSHRSGEVEEYVGRKLSNKTVIKPGGKKELRGPAQFAVDDEGATVDIADKKKNERSIALDSAESDKGANLDIISAISNSFKRLADQMRSLSGDVVSYMRRKKDQGRSTAKRAAFIDGMVNAGMSQIESAIDPNNPDALKNIKKMGLQINKDFQIDFNNIKWSKLISMEHGARIVKEVNNSAKENGQPPVFQEMPSFDDFRINPMPLLQFSLKKISPGEVNRFIADFGSLFSKDPSSGLIVPELKTNDPNYFAQLQSFYKDALSDYYKRVYVTAELAIDEIGQYLMYLGSTGKYSKDLLLSFLSLLRTHTGVRQGKYPGGRSDHPSVGAYQNISQGKFDKFDSNPDFEQKTIASMDMKFSLFKSAISQICDIANIRISSNIKEAGSSYYQDIINDIILNTNLNINNINENNLRM